MAENCTHNCSSCGKSCSERDTKSLIEAPNKGSHVKKVIAVVSGKGGVGKSLVTSLMAAGAVRKGCKAGILDADITGPSIPKVYGLEGVEILGSDDGMIPAVSATGVEVMSINLLLEDQEAPVIWRGPVIAGAVKQFWTDVSWGNLDYLFVDMPPGTGDVPLTVFQSLPVDGIIIVTSPQELVSMIVGKAVRMAEQMNIPVLGLVENMSYLTCPDCGKKIHLFGENGAADAAARYGIEKYAELPIDPEVTSLCDHGNIEAAPEYMTDAVVSLL